MKICMIALISLVAGAFAACSAFVWLMHQRAKGPELFRRYVRNPVPSSVSRVRVDQPQTLRGYGYTFRFEIDASELAVVCDSRQLKRVHDVNYIDGVLDWKWDASSGVMISPYNQNSWPREPRWFAELATWKDVEAYALRQRQNGRAITEILIYNQRLGEACFVTFNVEDK